MIASPSVLPSDPGERPSPGRTTGDTSTPPDLALYEAERATIQRRLAEAWAQRRSPPWETFVVVVDLRGAFGRLLGLHLYDRRTLDRRVRRAGAGGALPSLSVPLTVEDGLALVGVLAPELLPIVDEGPLQSIPMLIVDARDTPRVGFGILSGQWVTIH